MLSRPQKRPIVHPQLNGFSIGDTFESQDGSKTLTIVDFDPGSLPGKGIMRPPSVYVEIENPNPEYTEDKVKGTRKINDTANETREVLGLERKITVAPPSTTLKETRDMDVEVFLTYVNELNRIIEEV